MLVAFFFNLTNMSKKKKKDNDVIKALHRAERELQFVRNGYDHPWIAVNRVFKNKKAYNRKREHKIVW